MDLSIAELLGSGLKLMLIGMGIVFFFLLLLVAVIRLSKAILQRLEHPSSTPPLQVLAGPASDEQQLVVAITAAIHQYQQTESQ